MHQLRQGGPGYSGLHGLVGVCTVFAVQLAPLPFLPVCRWRLGLTLRVSWQQVRAALVGWRMGYSVVVWTLPLLGVRQVVQLICGGHFGVRLVGS